MGQRKKPETPETPADGTIVLFTGLSLILLAFFIVLNNLAALDSARSRTALDSLLGTFGIMPGFDSEGTINEEQPFSHVSTNGPIGFYDELNEIMEEVRVPGMEIKTLDDGRITLQLDTDLLFTSGHHRISPAFFPVLDAIGRVINEVNCSILVEGHTDRTSASGTRSNWYLSAARATIIYRYLEETAEIMPGLISTAGYADTRPVGSSNSSHENRRVEITFIPDIRP